MKSHSGFDGLSGSDQGQGVSSKAPDPNCPKCHGTGKDDSLTVVWDAGEGCEHAWGDESTVSREEFQHGWDGNLDKNPNPRETGGLSKMVSSQGAFCLKCGAWKGQLGLEPTPDLYVKHIVQVFRAVWPKLRDDGTLWLNMGDCYNGSPPRIAYGDQSENSVEEKNRSWMRPKIDGLKPKDLVGMPWRVAFALQADGWYLRSDIIWAKPNPMPESVTDRPTKAHEYVFLLTKNGDNIYWTHRDKNGTRVHPEPDWRWVRYKKGVWDEDEVWDAEIGDWIFKKVRKNVPIEERDTPPEGWHLKRRGCCDGAIHEEWDRINLWEGRTYFYDADAVRESMAESTIARARYHYPNPVDNPDYESKHPFGDFRRFPIQGQLNPKRRPDLAGEIRGADGGFGHEPGWRKNTPDLGGRNLRSVWTIPTEPYPEAHFATFPKRLVEPCIKAGTSEKGCCATCGAAWERVSEKTTRFGGGSGAAGMTAEEINASGKWAGIQYGKNIKLGPQVSTKTIGFRPTCDHAGDPVPCVVLDPFGGSGTVGEVARSLGRSAVLIEIKSEYAELARKRIDMDHRALEEFEA